MGDIIINQQRNDGYSHQNRSSFALAFSFLPPPLIPGLRLILSLSGLPPPACSFCYLSFGYIYIDCFVLYCYVRAFLFLSAFVCVRVRVRYCTEASRSSLAEREQYANPFFVQRYDTLLMLHFRFATRMTASIWLCLATNTHTIQSITFPSQFFLVAAAAVGAAAPCAFFTVGAPTPTDTESTFSYLLPMEYHHRKN